MTKAKSLLLGSAAALVAVSGAQAADLGLPVAPAVDYVQICSVGSFTGFLLPGSDVCFDISGFAQWQTNFNGEDADAEDGAFTSTVSIEDTVLTQTTTALSDPVSNASVGSDDDDDFDMVAEIELNFDARTMTEWGLLRGFVRLGGDGGEEDFNVDVPKAFVQLGGLTAGITDSFFDPVFTDYAVAPFGDVSGTEDLALIGYAFNAGNGLTFMASLEDGEARNTGILSYVDANRGITAGAYTLTGAANTAAANTAVGGDDDAVATTGNGDTTFAASEAGAAILSDGTVITQTGAGAALVATVLGDDGYDESATMPDFVAALRVDQAWGSAKLSAALHEVDPFQEDVDSEFGYAFGASAEFNLPVGYGSTFGVFGNYAIGAVEYVGFDTEVGSTSLPFYDAVYDVQEDDLDLATAFGFGAGVDIGLTEELSWQLEGYYTHIDHEDVTITAVNEGTVANSDDFDGADTVSTSTIDYDGSIFAIRSSVKWEPVSGLLLAAGVAYQVSDFDEDVVGDDADDDQFGARLRIRRSF